jgi:hypothetical protein
MNNAADAMVEHGIMTSEADYWVHFFPLLKQVFWYRADHCRDYVRLKNLVETIGRSKDGSATGAGYLIPQNAYFVSSVAVPDKYVAHLDWRNLTDRESGFNGEAVVCAMLEHRVIVFPPMRAFALHDRESQNRSIDISTKYFGGVNIELKTERVDSRNLYVQTRERGHKVHLTNDGTERVTDAPALT